MVTGGIVHLRAQLFWTYGLTIQGVGGIVCGIKVFRGRTKLYNLRTEKR